MLKEATHNDKKVMTLAQKIENRGIQKGILKIAKSMLKNEIPFDLIKKTTGLSTKELEELEKLKELESK